MKKISRPILMRAFALLSLILATGACSEPVASDLWSAGYRFELLTADGDPANDMVGSGVFLHYDVSDGIGVELAFEYVEYDFESPQRYLGLPRVEGEKEDARTRSTLISMRVRKTWKPTRLNLHPLLFAGVGMGYTVIDDVQGGEGEGAFDINAEGGIETVPGCGVGLLYCRNNWTLDGGIKVERHIVDWDLENRLTGVIGEVGDYTAWGGWLGLSVLL